MGTQRSISKSGSIQYATVVLLLGTSAAPMELLATGSSNVYEAVAGDSVVSVVRQARAAGHSIVNSSIVLPDSVLIARHRAADDPIDLLSAVLKDVGLDLKPVDGLLAVVRARESQQGNEIASLPHASPAVELAPPLPEVITTASRYEILRESRTDRTEIMRRDIEVAPTFGADPIRALHRLPGVASGGVSAKAHIRGSEANDTAVILNGQRLLDPFHVRDYQSLFSAIDSRAIDRLEVYTGGFPALYGDRMGGIVVVDTVRPEREVHSEMGLSVFNASVLNRGRVADLEWSVSARRGNLDQIIDRKYGRPSYYDLFGEVSVAVSPKTKLSINGLVASDDILIVTEDTEDELESSRSDVHNSQFWAIWTQDWTENLASQTILSSAEFQSDRAAVIDDPESVIGFVNDRRRLRIFGVRQNWQWAPSDVHQLTFGWEVLSQVARYGYQSDVQYFGQQIPIRDNAGPHLNLVAQKYDGSSHALFVSDSWRLSDKTVAELGFRVDQQTFTSAGAETQFSPRLGLIHELRDDLRVRASVGRYHQSQGIHELQVEDGVDRFFPAQRADHLNLGVDYWLSNDLSLRFEAYYKKYSRLRPRFENLLDPLAVIPELEPDRVRIAPDSAYARGFEVALAYEGRRGLSWWASYANSKAYDRFGSHSAPRSWDQRHAVQLGMTWSNDVWEVGLGMNAHSGWPTTEIYPVPGYTEGNPVVRIGERNGARFGAFGSLDFRVGYKRPIRDGVLHLFFELANATNRRNVCCADFDIEADQGGRLFLEREYDYWLPRLPSFGFLVEF